MEKKRRIKKVEREFLFSLGLKYCPTCRQIKKIVEFNNKQGTPNNKQYRCRTCQKQISQTAGFKKSKANYSQSNKGKITSKKYTISNKGRIAQKKYAKLNSIKINVRRITRYHWRQASDFPCAHCRQPAEDWHHFEYSDDWRHHTIPICSSCHTDLHTSRFEI